MKIIAAGKMIISVRTLFLVLVIVLLGYALVHVIANRKWGYSPKREKELEEADKVIKMRK